MTTQPWQDAEDAFDDAMVRYERATTDKQRRYALLAAHNALQRLQGVIEAMRFALVAKDAA